jgi:thymidylate synthase (FAD)
LVTTDIASHIHIIKHRIGVAVNGESARYKELKDDKFFVPVDWDSEEQANYIKFMEDAYRQYHNALERLQKKYVQDSGMSEADARKRAKESARLYLPYGNQIQADVMFNFRSFYHFLSLRYSTHAQKEIRDIARMMLEQVIATGKFDHTLRAFELVNDDGIIRGPFTDHFHLPEYEK